MENPKLITKYREQLIVLHGVTIGIVSVVEIIAYFIFVHLGIQSLSIGNRYLLQNVALPILINVVAHLFARAVNESSRAKQEYKNASIIYAAFVTALVVSLFHRDYTAALCSFVFPIILSALFNNRNLLRQSLWIAIFSLTVTVIALFMENKLDLTKGLNVMVLYGFVVVSYLSGVLSIKFSDRNFSVIEEQAIANSKLENIIVLDQMTGLYNHSAFYDKLDNKINESKSENIGCCLAMIDIDDFKMVNDEYGHDAGDVVIVTVANILKDCCDDNDIACRYGGEEFAVIFTGKTIEQAQTKINMALKMLSQYKFDFTDKSLTFSCGISKFDGDETSNEMFVKADECLYMSKRNGKNRITV